MGIKKNVFILLILALLTVSAEAFEIDLSDHILKIDNLEFFPIAQGGFALYDDGDEHLKLFNWRFQMFKKIPLKKGEGPGEMNGHISALCITESDTIILNLSYDNTIRIYDLSGKQQGELSIRMQAGRIHLNGGKAIILNNNFDKSPDNRMLIAKIINTRDLRPYKDIVITNPHKLPKEFVNYDIFIGNKIQFSPGKENNLFLLFQSQDVLYEFDFQGNLKSRTDLPYHTEIEKNTQVTDKSGKQSINYIQYLHSYYNIQRAGESVYLCYYKCLERKPGAPDKFALHVLKILPDKSIREKVFHDKLFYIIGGHQKMVYFFDANDYKVTGINEDEWK